MGWWILIYDKRIKPLIPSRIHLYPPVWSLLLVHTSRVSHVPLGIRGPVFCRQLCPHAPSTEWIHCEPILAWSCESGVCLGGRETGKLSGCETFLTVTLLTREKQPGLVVKSLLI